MRKAPCIAIIIIYVFWLTQPTKADLRPVSCAEYVTTLGGVTCDFELSDGTFDFNLDYLLMQDSKGLICGDQSTANNHLFFSITKQTVSLVGAKGYSIVLTNFTSDWETTKIVLYKSKGVEYPETPAGTYVIDRASLELRVLASTHSPRKIACRLTSPREILSYYRDKIAGAQNKNKI